MPPSDSRRVTIIEPRARHEAARVGELVRFRGYYPFLLREITMRKWRNTFLGFWWLILRPLIPTVMAIVVFTFIAPIQSYGLPYAVFYLSGFIAWNLLQSTVSFVPRTMLWMRGTMKKTYFPRLLVPLASIGPPLIELLVTVVMFVIALAIYAAIDGVVHLRADAGLLLLPFCLVMTLMLGVAIGMVASMIALFVRDIIYSIGYFAQVFMFLTPVLYPIGLVPETYRWIIYLLNPMAALVETARWSLTGSGLLEPVWLAVSCVMILCIALGALWFFLKIEPVVNDAL